VTDGLDQALANSGLNLLRADTGLTVYDAVVPNGVLRADQPVPPFVVVYVDLTQPASWASNLDGRSQHRTVAWYCHCVGADPIAARAVAQRVRTALIDVRPTVAGIPAESVGLISEVQSAPAGRDESLGFAVITALRVYELHVSA
jgi:hypothetical protein